MGKYSKISAFSFYAAVYLSILLLLLPLDWVTAVVLAAFVHEISHIAAAMLLNGSIKDVRVGFRGITIHADGLNDWRCMLAILAGPAASIYLISFYRSFPKFAFCGLCQGVYNLIPISPSDGWNLCNLACRKMISKKRAEWVLAVLEQIAMWSVFVISIIFMITKHSTVPLIVDALVLGKKIPVKIPCKQRKQRVQ